MAKSLLQNLDSLLSSCFRTRHLAVVFFCVIAGVQASLYAQPNVYFELKNEAVVGGTHYHFDVFMYADQPGTYHNKGQIYIIYDTTAFGEAIVFNGSVTNCPTGNTNDPSCTGIHLDLLSERINLPPVFINAPKYRTTLNDNGDKLAATWISSFENVCPPNATTHTLVPDTSTGLYHFEVLMKNPLINPKLDFYFPLMLNQQFFSNPAPPSSGVNCDQPYGNGGLLPVNMTFFKAMSLENKHVQLNWQTSREQDHSHFVVEKKRGEGEFEPLAWVLGQGNSEEELSYEYVDRSLMAELNFYRLKMVDIDGNASYSEIVEIRHADLKEDFAIYPVPANDYLIIQALSSIDNEVITCQIINPQGQLISTETLPGQGQVRISTKSLASGIYYIRILRENAISFQKQFAKR